MSAISPIQVLVADASLIYRTGIPQICKEIPQIEFVGAVNTLRQLRSKISQMVDHIIICDIDILENELFQDIPEFNNSKINWIFISHFKGAKAIENQSFLHKNSHLTIAKPHLKNENDAQEIVNALKASIEMRIKRILNRKIEKTLALNGLPTSTSETAVRIKTAPPQGTPNHASSTSIINNNKLHFPPLPPEFILIGISTGGPSALHQILPQFRSDFPLPIIIVQHIPAGFSASLADGLDKKCELHVKEASEDEIPVKGNIYIAPGGIHLTLNKVNKTPVFKLNDSPPENSCKPAVDVLFRSASLAYPGKCISIILTGMGSDGTKGLIELKKSQCFSIVQDEKSCTVWGMPRAAFEAGLADLILPLDQVVPQIYGLIKHT